MQNTVIPIQSLTSLPHHPKLLPMPVKWTHRLQLLLYFWVITFSGATLIFLFETNTLIAYLNLLSQRITPNLPLLNLTTERFWLALTMSLMITLIYICLSVATDVKRRLHFIPILLISKFVSTLFFIIFFFNSLSTLAYLIGAAVDGSIFLITFLVYNRARKEGFYKGY